MNWVRHGGSTTFETKSSYCRVARQRLPCYTAVTRLGFKTSRYCRAKVEFNSINWVRHGSSATFETGLRLYKKTWCTCKAVVLLIKPIAFWCTLPAKTSKTNGCFLLLRKTLLVHFVFCWQNLLYYVFGVFVPLRNTKKLPNKQKQLIKTKTRSHAKTKASLADIFLFLLNTEPGPRLPSWKCVLQPFRPRSPAQSQSGE